MPKQTEKGQIAILLAAAMVLLLAMMALAIDGGMIYSDRRYDQNVADSSALAGGAAAAMIMETNEYAYNDFSCSDELITDMTTGARARAIEYAVTRADVNLFTDFDADVSDKHGVEVVCEDGDANNDGRPDSPIADKYLRIHVWVTQVVDTSFVHFFYDGDVTNVVDAVVEVRPRRPIAYGNAVVALSTDCDNSMEFKGVGSSGPIEIFGGNLVTNGCYNISGNTEVIVDDLPGQNLNPGVYYYDPNASGTNKWGFTSPYPEPMTELIPTDEVEEPDCSGLPDFSAPSLSNTSEPLEPGNYPSLDVPNHVTVYLKSGLYCFDGNVDVGGHLKTFDKDPDDGAAYAATDLVNGVTLFLKNGDFTIQNSNSLVDIHAPLGIQANVTPALKGMVLFSSYNNTDGIIDLSGGSNGGFDGTVFAPTSHVDIGGNSDLLGNCQVIAYSVTGHGTDKVTVNYVDNELFMIPNYIDLME